VLSTVATAPTVVPADPCHWGNAFCLNGSTPHNMCASRSEILWVPGDNGTLDRVLEVAIESYDDDDPAVLAWSGNGHSSVPITSDTLRQIVAQAAAHLPKLLGLADEFDALGKVAAESTAAVTAPVAEVVNHPMEFGKITLQLDEKNPNEVITAEGSHWPAEQGVDGHPGFPALTQILLSEYLDMGLMDLTPDQARALVPRIHRFADELGQLADQVDAFVANGGAL
jgi:hypothetical protein